MARYNIARLGRLAKRNLERAVPAVSRPAASLRIPALDLPARPVASRFFSLSSRRASPLAPDVLSRVKPAELTTEHYHELSDEYLDNLLNKFEAAQDERDDLDVEYSVSHLPS